MAETDKSSSPVPFHVKNADGMVVRRGKREDTETSWKPILDFVAANPGYVLVRHEEGQGVAGFAAPPIGAKVDEASKIIAMPLPSGHLPVGEKLKTLRAACAAAITGGFLSNALNPGGSGIRDAYIYPSDLVAQMNLHHGGPILCADSNGVWLERDHTEEQRAKVLAAFVSLREASRTRLKTLSAQAQTATTQEELDAVQWGSQ